MAARVTAADFAAEVLQSELPVLADFYSDSCVPCKRLSPLLSRIETEYEGKLRVVKINVQYEPELVAQYNVQAAPTLLFFRGGEEINRIRGAVTKDALYAAINEEGFIQ